ncbi:contractile injection system protein, VgrG/Pvc8 family [Serratia bockelmannii]|uniref:contractile injection system protein, VgrG/Pvc8 family n=1 Tax=Serratia bockelmannii TaxID=2703793 RepID=UPI003FA7A2F7
MTDKSFNGRITQALDTLTAHPVAPDGGAGTPDAPATPLNAWADKIGTVAAVAGAVATVTGSVPGLSQKGKNTVIAPLTVVIHLGGQAVDPTTVFIEKLQTRHAVNEIPSAMVVLSLPHSAPDDYTALDQLMGRCQIGQSATVRVDQMTVFDGVVGDVKVSSDASGRRVKVRLRHALQGLKSTLTSRIWTSQPDTTLIREVLHTHQIKNTVTLAVSEAVQRFQWNCSDWYFLRAVLGLHGAWLWPHADGSVTVQSPGLGGKAHRISATPGPGGVTLLDAEWGYSGVNQRSPLSMQSWDLSTQSVVKKTAKKPSLGSGGLSPAKVKALGRAGMTLLTGQWDGAHQQAAVNGWLAAQQAQAVRVRLTVAGCLAYQVGDTLVLDGFGSHLSGQGIVTQVEYQCSVNGRQGKTVIGIGLDEEVASAPPLSVPTGQVIGQVAPFQADPHRHWNRLPVTIPLLGRDVIWARMGHVYASKNSGVTFYPEAGDEVVLGFVGGDPVILASLHNPKRTAAIEPSAKNAKKGMVLRHDGQRMELSVDRDAHRFTWALGTDKTPEQQMVADQEKGVVLTSQKGNVAVEVRAGEMSVTTKKNIRLETEEQVTVTGKTGVTVTGGKDVILDAKAQLVGHGKTRVEMASAAGKLELSPEKANLSANQTRVVGTLTVDIQGNEAVKMKSSKVDLTGDVQVAIAGATVSVKGTAQASVEAAAVKVTGEMTDVGGAGTTNVKGTLINLG